MDGQECIEGVHTMPPCGRIASLPSLPRYKGHDSCLSAEVESLTAAAREPTVSM